MLTKRIIPCLDVKNGYVVKGVKFRNHEIVGSILDLASKYNEDGADELVFYDIGASTYDGMVSKEWVKQIYICIICPSIYRKKRGVFNNIKVQSKYNIFNINIFF